MSHCRKPESGKLTVRREDATAMDSTTIVVEHGATMGCWGEPPLWRTQHLEAFLDELRPGHSTVAIEHRPAPEKGRGFVGVVVYGDDGEAGGAKTASKAEVDTVVRAIESRLPQITEATKSDFARRRRCSSALCWSTILVLFGNYWFRWI